MFAGFSRVVLCVGFALCPAAVAQNLLIQTEPGRQAVLEGETVQFTARDFADPNYAAYAWQFGDGTQAEGAEVTHAFAEAGRFTVVLQGRDASGNASEPSYKTIFVIPAQWSDTSSWEETVNGIIAEPAEDGLVAGLGTALHFEAQEQENATYFWEVAGTLEQSEGRVWDWTIPADWDEGQYRVQVTGIHETGIADPWPDSRTLYVYRDVAPPDVALAEPDLPEDGVFRLDLGDSITFTVTASAPEARLPLTIDWRLYCTGSLDAAACNAWPGTDLAQGTTSTFTPDQTGYHQLQVNATDVQDVRDPFPLFIGILVKDENRAPDGMIPTPSQVISLGDPLTLEAEGSDPDNDVIAFRWDLGDGRTMEGASIEPGYTTAGVYVVSVTAIDSAGAADATPFQRLVLVNDPDLAPINAEPQGFLHDPDFGSAFAAGQAIEFRGFASDRDDQELSIYWDFDDGRVMQAPMSETFPGLSVMERSYAVAGRYHARMFARDARGFASRSVEATQFAVFEGAVPPEARVLEPRAPDSSTDELFLPLNLGQSVSFRGTVDGVDDLTGYDAAWGISPPSGIGLQLTGFEPAPFTPTEAGLYYVQLDVTDPAGIEDPFGAPFYLDVRDNFEPEGRILEPAFDLSIPVNTGITLAAEGSDRDGDALTFLWTLSDGRTMEGARLEEVRFPEAGLFRLTLTLIDARGSVVAVPGWVYVNVLPESAGDTPQFAEPQALSPTGYSVNGPAGSRFLFEVAEVDDTQQPLTGFLWDFGDGRFDETARPGEVAFENPGYYGVRVFVRDRNGVWSPYARSWEVIIYGDNTPPEGTIVTPAPREHEDPDKAREIPVLIDTEVSLNATASDPDGNYPLSVIWSLDYETYSFLAEPPPLTFGERGTHIVTLAVHDSENQSDPDQDFRRFKAVDPSLLPESIIAAPDGEITVEPGQEVRFFGYGEDPNELDLEYEWNFGTGATPSQATGAEVAAVVFHEETPDDAPHIVTFKAKTLFTEDDTPAELRVFVKRVSDAELEPNNAVEEAAPLGRGTYSNLSISGEDPVDFYRFVLEDSGRDMLVSLRSAELLDFRLTRLEASVWTPVSADSFAVSDKTLTFQNLPSGQYTLEVRSAEPAKLGKRRLSYGFSVETVHPSLYLPFLVEDGSFGTWLGILNPSDSPTEIAIVGLDAAGAVVETKTRTLAPRQRLYQPSLDFFGKVGNVEKARQIRWVKVLAPRRLVGFSTSVSHDGSQLVSSGAHRSLQSSVMLPHIAQATHQWYTRAVLVNAAERQGRLQFHHEQNQTDLENVAKDGQADFRFFDLFGEAPPAWGTFQLDNGAAGIAGLEIFGRKDGAKQAAALEMLPTLNNNPNFTRVGNDLYFTHVARDTVNFWTGVALINQTQVALGYQVFGYDDAGNVVVELRDQQLGPGEKFVDTVAQWLGEPSALSWIRVEADAGIAGLELFGTKAGTSLAGFPAADYLTDRLYFPFVDERAGESWTGIVVLNISQQEVAVTLRAFTADGALVAERVERLGPREKRVALPADLFGQALPETTASIVVEAETKALNGFQLFGSLENGRAGGRLAGILAQTD
ncbi:PKD domain-containing protein [Sulfidibacter corallicola]|uniref:PKD domain-containing protein n=1 Tax=Sulfidibacter corallicola TaxID=2818388 RepID=A0A8A4TI24_SULCO|nr:PKD domain-containing protein [Sulfidibacter corallicola]QTD48428.1 PKD domain-containing protein [Sulfidibacter corallicola]